ncbi:MAG: penicillin-binding protein 1C [Polyangiaceae bacterium]|nr:penicillin-binding protein 1C [Polyangiaceae bacterium]
MRRPGGRGAHRDRVRARRRAPGRRWLGRATAAACACALALLGWRVYRSHAGEPSSRLAERWHESTRIVDRHGAPLREVRSSAGLRGRELDLDAMGERLVTATLFAEDRRFYEHGGVDVVAVVRAVGQNLESGRVVSGASTITQQLVKLLDGAGEGGERTLAGKLFEAARAANLEDVLDKSAILEAYLNRLPYGRGLVGPAAASQAYFGREPRDLSWAQAALLAVLPRAPGYLDPVRHLERAQLRQGWLLAALREAGVLDAAGFERARTEPVEVAFDVPPFEAPHFALRVEAMGRGPAALGGAAPGPEGVVRTTLDLELQRAVEGLVRAETLRLRPRGAADAAALVVDNATGEVLAYVGSAGFGRADIDGSVDMVRARRQPGSTLKPFVYALAFERGVSPVAMLADVPSRFGEGPGAYAPENFDGTFLGPVSAREALAGSLNVPAVRLAAELGTEALLERLHALGFASLDRPAAHYGLALALGSGEVALEELAVAYLTLARGGTRVPLRLVGASPGELGQPEAGVAVVDPAAAALVTDALADPAARLRVLGGRGPFELAFPVAVKTGTSSGYRDAWTVGYTHERTVAVWVGNADRAASAGVTGADGAGPLFADVMRRAMRAVPLPGPLYDRSLVELRAVCPLSGRPRGEACPEAVTRAVAPRLLGAAAEEPCRLHRHAERIAPTPVSGARAIAAAAPYRCARDGRETIAILPGELAPWLATRPFGQRDPTGVPWLAAADALDCSASERASARLRVPAEGAVLYVGEGGVAQAEAEAEIEGDAPHRLELELVVDRRPVGTRRAGSLVWSLALERGEHELEVRPVDPRVPLGLGRRRVSVR